MWDIVRTAPISVLLVITTVFLVIGIARTASISIVANGQKLPADIFLFLKKILKGYVHILLFFIEFLTYPVIFLSYFILLCVPNFFYPKLPYPIEDEILSTTTWVIFTRRKHIKQQICLKPWQFNNEMVCNPKLVKRRMEYLLEGLEFNRRFAPGVYLGVAPVEPSKKPKKILRRKLIKQPDESKLKNGVDYALVMRRLEDMYRLDQQIYNQKFVKIADMQFLAKEVARMHKRLDNSPEDRGTLATISSKLEINRQLFEECLSQLTQDQSYIEKHLWISSLMVRAYETYRELFQQRYVEHHIKRCHGDLKTTNLWIEPERYGFFGLKKHPQRLIALDCVDFNPNFCHIDTLSDIAMLTIDLEMYISNWFKMYSNRQEGEELELAQYFLAYYLREMQEDNGKWNPLLEYYMTEKSMICAYVSTLYDERPVAGERYLKVALTHAEKLQNLLDDRELEYTSTSRQAAIGATRSL